MTDKRLDLLVSGCLTGQTIRFDGGHKHNHYLTDVLSPYFRLQPVCPEVAAGLGVPRPPIRLVDAGNGVRVLGTRDPGIDVTEPLEHASATCARKADSASGAILNRGSPTCGLERVKVYSAAGMPAAAGSGLFAQALQKRHPLLPIEEEGRLQDPLLRDNFFVRVFVYHRWQKLCESGLSAGALVDFHTRHKLLLMSHDQAAYRRVGPLIARAGVTPLEELAPRYFELLMQGLSARAGRRQHTNVLQHLLGYLRGRADPIDRRELRENVEAYRRGTVPLVVPVTLLKDYFRRCPDAYIAGQYYLQPYPEALGLRNAI